MLISGAILIFSVHRSVVSRATTAGTSASTLKRISRAVCFSLFSDSKTRTHYSVGGGCAIPSPFLLGGQVTTPGVDCTAIEGADSVSCSSGSCIVKTCKEGWTVSAAGNVCDENSSANRAAGVLAHAWKASGMVGRAPQLGEEVAHHAGPKEPAEKPHDDYYASAWF